MNNILSGLKRYLVYLVLGISGMSIDVRFIEPPSEDLGYTSLVGPIYVAYAHQLMEDLTDEEKKAFSIGLCIHEMMHKIATDFTAFIAKMDTKPRFEQAIFRDIFNVMEDPAIEHLAGKHCGGTPLRCLRWMILDVYRKTPEIDTTADPFIQFINACIQYGDGGLIKGEMVKEAKEMFIKALPLLDKTIIEPNGAKRVKYADEVFEMTRPLWIGHAKSAEAMQQFLDALAEAMEECGKEMSDSATDEMRSGSRGGVTMSGSSDSSNEEDDDDAEGEEIDPKAQARAKTAEMLNDEGEGKDANGKGADGEDADGETDGASEDADGKASETSPDGENSNAPSKNGNGITFDYDGVENDKLSDTEHSGDNQIDYDDYELTDGDFEAIGKEIAENLKEAEREAESDKVAEEVNDLDIPVSDKEYSGVKSINLTVKGVVSDAISDEYNQIVAQMSRGIKVLTSQLERLIKNELEDCEYKTSGRLSVNRYTNSRMTARVFERHAEPKNRGDVAVMVLVDCSGSMYGKKIAVARQAAIGLAEVFAKVHIPYKVMGFTADDSVPNSNGEIYDAIHTHYVNWHDNRSERIKLLSLDAGGCNFDGYSIRYASQLLSKRPEEHKLMIVVSDGQPNSDYCNGHGIDSISDTKRAIRLAKKSVGLVGVAIDANVDVLHSMYGNNFVYIQKVDDLFAQLGNKIRKEIAQW